MSVLTSALTDSCHCLNNPDEHPQQRGDLSPQDPPRQEPAARSGAIGGEGTRLGTPLDNRLAPSTSSISRRLGHGRIERGRLIWSFVRSLRSPRTVLICVMSPGMANGVLVEGYFRNSLRSI
jgi:hypothetical protein